MKNIALQPLQPSKQKHPRPLAFEGKEEGYETNPSFSSQDSQDSNLKSIPHSKLHLRIKVCTTGTHRVNSQAEQQIFTFNHLQSVLQLKMAFLPHEVDDTSCGPAGLGSEWQAGEREGFNFPNNKFTCVACKKRQERVE